MKMCISSLGLSAIVVAFAALLPTTNSDTPQWRQRACERQQTNRPNAHYICDDKDNVKCLPGWQGDLCQVPMCRKGCDPMNGYCQRPGECRCRIGYSGEMCDKCIPLPGCQHGYCNKPFECICKPGWDGLFCTEPSCRQGCHSTRGYCESPKECRCRIGWAGRNCSECATLPGCQHGTCKKPLECQCMAGYTGLLCQTPLCSGDCHKQHGYCRKPGECRCRIGWTGENCDKCFPYPGCVNGDCEKPWECNCRTGWGGMLCNEELTYCDEHLDACENDGKCVSLTKEDGSYRCICKQGYLGKNCEIVDEFLLTSTAAPRITPPPQVNAHGEEAFNAKNADKLKIKLNGNNVEIDDVQKHEDSNKKGNDKDAEENSDEEYEDGDEDEDDEGDEDAEDIDSDDEEDDLDTNGNEIITINRTTTTVATTASTLNVHFNQTEIKNTDKLTEKPNASKAAITTLSTTMKATTPTPISTHSTTTAKATTTTQQPRLLKKPATHSKYKNDVNNLIERTNDKPSTYNLNSRYAGDDSTAAADGTAAATVIAANGNTFRFDYNIIPDNSRRRSSSPIIFPTVRINDENYNKFELFEDAIAMDAHVDLPTGDFDGTAMASA